MNTKPKLRVGILINRLEVQAWVYQMLELIQASDYAAIELVVINASPVPESNRTLREKLQNNAGRIGYLAVRSLLDRLHDIIADGTNAVDAADARVDASALLAGIPSITVNPEQTRFSDYFPDEDVASIRSADLDVIIRIGFRILRGDILHCARAGVWSFHHGDNRVNRGGPAGFWEVMESWPVTGSVLQVLSEDMDNGLVLERTWTRTNINGISDTRSKVLWKSLAFIPRNLRRLHQLGANDFLRNAALENGAPELYSAPLYKQPENGRFFWLLCRKALEKLLKGMASRFYTEQWQLLYQFGSELSTTIYRFKAIDSPGRRNWADPTVITHAAEFYIFFEDFIGDGPGHLSVIKLNPNGEISEPETVLKTDHHLSYPFIFRHEDEYYMVPESMATGNISLYRCTKFPDQWEFHSHLMQDIVASDSTLHFHNGKWWLFTCIAQREHFSASDELYLFYADDFRSAEWTPHPLNPIVSDVRSARPAGRVLQLMGKLYRPSQISAPSYGYGLNLNEILVMNETEYHEVRVSSATPDWQRDVVGLHTLSYEPGLTVIDARFRKRKWSWLRYLGF